MSNKILTDRDNATRKATAFRSWDAFLNAVQGDGYFPTLNRETANQRRFGALVEAEGIRVYWTGRAVRHAA